MKIVHEHPHSTLSPFDQLLNYPSAPQLGVGHFFAITSCNQSGNDSKYHFAGAGKMIGVEKVGGTLPENIPVAEPIKHVVKRVKSATPKFQLKEKDAKGLASKNEK
ncbi:MAG: hypothetical protein HY465_05780 [Deltaproteobacteria bacterium]|nr:hypothetical protein [Deltaproteobacteria bacterium]